MSWLLDTDVMCQPAKRHGDARVVAWIEEEQEGISCPGDAAVAEYESSLIHGHAVPQHLCGCGVSK